MNLNYKLVVPIAILVLAVIAGSGYYLYSQNQKSPSGQNPPSAQEEVKGLVSEVGKLIDLPTGEDPTVATVTDIEKLKDQPFFANAKNGDKVLIYTQAKKAILYDPNSKKILEVAPVNIGSDSAKASIKVVLRNGTKTTGLTTKYEPEVKKSLPDAQVIVKENASNDSFDRTVVVVLNRSYSDQAQKLAKDLKGAIESLPAGESNPKEGDILVILGKEKAS